MSTFTAALSIALTLLSLAGAEPPPSTPPMNPGAAEKARGAHATALPIPGITNTGDPTCTVVETVIAAPASRVWWVFATSEGFKKLGPPIAEVDFRRGGVMRAHYDPKGVLGDEGTIENQIIDFEPERMVSFRIAKPPKGFPFLNAYKSVFSIVTLTPVDEGHTRLRLAMLGYTPDEESQKMREFFEKGNAWTLDRLKKNLETGHASASLPTAQAAIDSSRFVASGPELDSFTREALVNATPADVFRAWTTPDGVKSFLGVQSNIDLAVGGPFEFYFGKDQPVGQRGSEGCQILAYVPARMLAWSWNAPPKFATEREKRTWVVLFLSPVDGDKTRVELVHSGFGSGGNWPEVRQYFERAWTNVLKALQDHYAKPGQ